MIEIFGYFRIVGSERQFDNASKWNFDSICAKQATRCLISLPIRRIRSLGKDKACHVYSWTNREVDIEMKLENFIIFRWIIFVFMRRRGEILFICSDWSWQQWSRVRRLIGIVNNIRL